MKKARFRLIGWYIGLKSSWSGLVWRIIPEHVTHIINIHESRFQLNSAKVFLIQQIHLSARDEAHKTKRLKQQQQKSRKKIKTACILICILCSFVRPLKAVPHIGSSVEMNYRPRCLDSYHPDSIELCWARLSTSTGQCAFPNKIQFQKLYSKTEGKNTQHFVGILGKLVRQH